MHGDWYYTNLSPHDAKFDRHELRIVTNESAAVFKEDILWFLYDKIMCGEFYYTMD